MRSLLFFLLLAAGHSVSAEDVCDAPHGDVVAGTFVPVRVVGVPHGGVVTVMTLTSEREIYDVALAQIDAPDLDQPYGDVSKEVLARKVFGAEGEVLVIAKVGTKWIGQLIINDGDINLFMVLNGLAWAASSATDPRYSDAMNEAKAAARGLWGAREIPVPPWRHRNDKANPDMIKPRAQQGDA